MSDRPDLALLSDRQLHSIREDLKEMQAKQGWADITDRDIETLRHLALTIDPEYRAGRGHDCQWLWSNGEIIITGYCDVYGHGGEAQYCRPQDWWLTADNEEFEP